MSAVRATCGERHSGVVASQGAEVVQLHIQRIVGEFHRLAGAQVLEVQRLLAQVKVVDAQRERLAVAVLVLRRAFRQAEQLRQVQRAVLGEQHLGAGAIEFHLRQVQCAAPQAVQLEIGVQALEAQMFLLGIADAQAPEAEFEAERVELQSLQRRGHRGELRQLLIGDAQGHARQNQKADQAVEEKGDQQGAQRALQSFGHGGASSIQTKRCLGVWHGGSVPGVPHPAHFSPAAPG